MLKIAYSKKFLYCAGGGVMCCFGTNSALLRLILGRDSSLGVTGTGGATGAGAGATALGLFFGCTGLGLFALLFPFLDRSRR
jgi:hypothetical protein